MEDVGYVLLMVGFVVLAVLFTIGCDKIIGPDEPALAGEETGDAEPGRRPEERQESLT
jgi:hypothetical protein